MLSPVAVAVIWLTLLNPDLGAVNWLLRSIGVASPPRWLTSPTWAVPSLVLMGLWGVGGGAIIYLAGLQNIPPHLYEAATIDGAGAWQRFIHITLPMLTPTLFFNLITGLIGAFQVFDAPFVLGGSRGGRSGVLLFYVLNLWNEGVPQRPAGLCVGASLGAGGARRDRDPDRVSHVGPLGLLRARARKR